MSSILENYLAGRGLPGVLVIEGHAHIGDWPHNATFRDAGKAAEESVRFMDANGVDIACSMSGGYMFGGADYRIGNDFLKSVCDRIPDRLVGFAHINPNDKQAAIRAELNRIWDMGFRCIKLINAYQFNYPGDGPNLMLVYEYAAEKRMLILDHAWHPGVMRSVAMRFPEVDFICGHYGYEYDPVLIECPNAYANIWNYGHQGYLDRALIAVGAAKMIYGADSFLNSMALGIGPIVYASVSDGDRRLMLGLTMARLLEKVGALPGWVRSRYPSPNVP